MDMIIVALIVGFIIIICILFIFYRYLSSLDEYVVGMAGLLERTFEHYYHANDIKPQAINWGIDLIWNPNNDETSQKKGFITIYYGEDSGVDTPIDDVVEADILSQKIIEVVDKHIQDKELGVLK